MPHVAVAATQDLIDIRDGATYFAKRVWGVSLRYDLGGSHPLAGRSAPDFELIDGTKIGTRLSVGKGLFLDFDARTPLQAFASRWTGRITYVARDAKNRPGLGSMLARPDGLVAWAADVVADYEGAAQAASRWFGEPERGA